MGRTSSRQIAGVEPQFATFDGNDPCAYTLSQNIHRRNFTRGQMAMVTVKASSATDQQERSATEPAGRSVTAQTARSLSEQAGISLSRIAVAHIVLRHAADLVDNAISGVTTLGRPAPHPPPVHHRIGELQ